MCYLLMFVATLCAVAEDVRSEFVSSGITQKIGGYSPVRSEMDKEAEIAKTAPEGLSAAKYGSFVIGDQSWGYILDEPTDLPAKLYVDANADGDFTNDPAAEWEANKTGELTMYRGSAMLELGNEQVGKIEMYRFDPNDARRAALKNTILFYSDFGYQLSFDLDGQEFKTYVAGTPSSAKSLAVDRDGNGAISYNFETLSVGKPFNFTGTTYVLNAKDGTLVLDKADEELPQLPMPPNLAVGKPALTFTAKTFQGGDVEFPSAYAGKIVMLDFWATWCGPCIGEIPNMKQAYADWHDKGFDILGISFDQEGEEEKLSAFLKENELPWTQIYEGKGWETELGKQHDVSGIPFVLLVDGDSGEILATARELRGEGLSKFIGEALAKKNPESKE